MLNRNVFIKALIISAFSVSLVFCFSNNAESWSVFDTFDMRISRQWQGLQGDDWSDWHINYVNKIQKSHDNYYNSIQNSGKGGYFKSHEIQYRPLIVWFAFNNGTVSEPILLNTSGSKKYDNFNVEVVEKTEVPEFPKPLNRVFMWDGEISDLIKYLKYKNVLPENYSLSNKIAPNNIDWDKI